MGLRNEGQPPISELLALGPVIPVITIDRAEDAVPMARALVAGGLRVLEVTLRTPAALDAIRAIRDAVPGAIVGAGTIVEVGQIDAAMLAGAQFGVCPGSTGLLMAGARSKGMPFLPGAVTPAEILCAREAGYKALKFFPAKASGGVEMLKAFAAPFPDIVFCPTGGIQAETAAEYLALPNVACVGGTWLTPPELLARKDWPAIEQLARAAATR